MKIVISNPRRSWGGASTMALGLARNLRTMGHEVVLFCRPGSPLYEELKDEIPCEPILYGADFPFPAIARAVKALRRHRPDVVLSSTRQDLRLTIPAAKIVGVPTVVRRVDIGPFSSAPLNKYLIDRLPDHFIANSRATREAMLASAPWMSESMISTVHNGIDVDRYADASTADLELPDGALAIGYIGRLEIEKGLPELAAAWPQVARALPHAHLVIAGIGNYEAEFRRALGDAPRVHWLGFRRDVPEIMKALDLLAMPSWEEPFGLVATEAMAAGTPLVATRAGGLAEVVEDGVEGILIPPRDADALRDALIRLANDPDLRRTMGQAGMETSRRRFSHQRVAEEYEAVLAAVARKKDE